MRVGRNELCPCGSGKKYKKCCLDSEPVRYTREDRAVARQLLDEYVMEHLGREDDEALDELWLPLEDLDEDLEPNLSSMSEQVGDDWFEFDRPLADGALVVDHFVEAWGHRLTRGQRQHLAVMKASTMRLYEIEDLRPGESLDLRDVVENTRVTVQERAGSRGLHRFDWIATRVVTVGASGKPELEGVLQFPPALQGPLREHLVKLKALFLDEHPDAAVEDFYRTMPPVLHEAWARAILDPYLPPMATTDGEVMVFTTVRFRVLDADALTAALDGAAGLERQGERPKWHWVGPNSKGAPIILGFLGLGGETLELETNSVERGQKGRALIEAAAGSAVRHQATSHEDAQQATKRELRRRRAEGPNEGRDETGIPAELREALMLDHLAQHYREWLDIPVPALDGATPRAAAKSPALRPRLIELSHELDGMYQRALSAGAPAFDPSWLWQELGLLEAPPHPPPLAFERVDQLVPGSGEVCRAVAEALRRQPSFAERAVTDDEVRLNLELQRFLRELPAQEGRPPLGPYLHRMVNFALQRKKAFWVDEALAFMLSETDIDLSASELRVPFPSFALVFTDRHVLSMAERLVAKQPECPVKGHYLKVATVFVTEHEHGDGEHRALDVCFAFDAQGADLPVLVEHVVPLEGEALVQAHLDSVAPLAMGDAQAHTNPLRGLLQVVVNAVLYATSAGVDVETRRAPESRALARRSHGGPQVMLSSEDVFFLPGAIEISQVRRLSELQRHSKGRSALRRFMVRGHWRRARADAADQRMHWVRPHWKGPDMATVIERTYKLKQ